MNDEAKPEPVERLDDAEKSSAELLISLQERADNLLEELKEYQQCLQLHGQQKEVEVRIFKRGIASEIKSLVAVSRNKDKRLDDATLDEFDIEQIESNHLHALRSANLPFYETVWSVARQCKGIVALGKRVHCRSRVHTHEEGPTHLEQNSTRKFDKGRSAVVDIICDDGLTWIKVSTVTEKRLLFEMAKEGWEGYGDHSDSDEEDADDHSQTEDDESSQLELVRLAKVLQQASRRARVLFKHPQVHLILPKVQEGLFDDVDSIVADIRSLGVTVICGSNTLHQPDDTSKDFEHLTLDQPSHNLARLLPSPSPFAPVLTPVLNIDCTILLALISDISHIPESQLPPYPASGHYHKAITRQIEAENASPLLPRELYAILCDRTLICTTQAAQRMREIVETMGTETEKQRASALVAQQDHTHTDHFAPLSSTASTTLHQTLQDLSHHPIPSTLRLPIHIVKSDCDPTHLTTLTSTTSILTPPHIPPADLPILQRLPARLPLSPINRSVFLTGWIHDIVTVTSNRAVAANIIRCIDQLLDDIEREPDTQDSSVEDQAESKHSGAEQGFVGPKIYVCGTARSLIGKEKQGS